MAKDMTTCKQAIQDWAKQRPLPYEEQFYVDPEKTDANGNKLPEGKRVAAEAKIVKLYAQQPPIKKMDNSLNTLIANCEELSLSSNAIVQIQPLNLRNLKILSLARNQIKRIERLDEVGGTLEQLWLSYNLIEKLTGLKALRKLTTLYLSNNLIRSFDELSNLSHNENLTELLLLGNPIYKVPPYDQGKDGEQKRRIEVLKRLPQLKKLDGKMVKPIDREGLSRANGDGIPDLGD
jgi:dynein light chain 1